jgi:hypothetical protein
MNSGILVAGKTEETNFALLFGFEENFSGATGAHEKSGIVLERNSVNLP